MPAFMFEKIPAPTQPNVSAATPTVREPRGVIYQMIDRLTESRLKREARALRRQEPGYTEADISKQRTRGD